ncbi:hypothetical protein PUN28_001089 [Cardiocondyla obscurior]|uniref:Uncharacterized protein n=1 Tax=Cardiocondyla obscurior TaxID=286306 RepID=A0AAW2H2X8_9HYME
MRNNASAEDQPVAYSGSWNAQSLEWETEVGVRVGVSNRLGEAIGKPVANLHGRVGQSTGEIIEKRPKRLSSGFQ